jgi:hypothetical protein
MANSQWHGMAVLARLSRRSTYGKILRFNYKYNTLQSVFQYSKKKVLTPVPPG